MHKFYKLLLAAILVSAFYTQVNAQGTFTQLY
jgi:hypothetical protein